jgi:hypothetical protein
VLERVLRRKLVFIETKDVVETTLALNNFKRACDCGRGAVFLSVARGKVSRVREKQKKVVFLSCATSDLWVGGACAGGGGH